MQSVGKDLVNVFLIISDAGQTADLLLQLLSYLVTQISTTQSSYGKEIIFCCPSLGKEPQAFLAGPELQSCILLLELPLGWGLTYYRNSCSSSSWRLYPGAHYHHCRGLGCCSEQSCWLFLYELQHKVPCPLAASVSCTFSCLYPEDQHVRPEHWTLSHRRVGKKTTNTIKISIFCSEVFPHSCPCSDFWNASMQEMPRGQ